jgi:hypothetical protein
MENLPLYLPLLFISITAATFWLLAKAGNFSKQVILLLLAWLAVQCVISSTGFYLDSTAFPPRFVVAVLPALIAIAVLMILPKTANKLQSFDIKYLTLIHVVRVPVEITLYFLFVYKAVPELMTFEGRNGDIISGITAPIIYLLVFILKKGNWKLLLAWNLLCLGLLLNIVVNAILSVPSPLQQQAFDQPAKAVLYFPYIWLPSFVVPAVLLAHLVSIQKLLRGKRNSINANDGSKQEQSKIILPANAVGSTWMQKQKM